MFLRTLAKHLGPKMGTTFVVDNVRGGSGARAVAKVAQSPADGSVLLRDDADLHPDDAPQQAASSAMRAWRRS